jgi:hypothetical protein
MTNSKTPKMFIIIKDIANVTWTIDDKTNVLVKSKAVIVLK